MRAIDFSRQTRDAGCLSDLALDRMVAGEGVDAAVVTHAAGCARCAARLDEFRRARQDDAALLDELRTRAPSVVPLRRRVWLSTMLPLLAAAALLLLFLPRLFHSSSGEREKGMSTLALDVVVRHSDGSSTWTSPSGQTRHAPPRHALVEVAT